MRPHSVSDFESIEYQAAQWVAREDRGLTNNECDDLSAWLEESTAHRIAFLRLKTSWQGTTRLAALKNSPQFESRPMSRGLVLPFAAAAALALVLAVSTDTEHRLSNRVVEQSYSSQFAERPVLRLSDGTRIQLNSNSKIRTKITSTNREVTLDKGEAYFEIAHDPSRPFAVYAGNRRITDIGTSFSVSRQAGGVRVIVTEGRVRVDLINSSPVEEPVFADKQNLIVAKADETLIAPKNSQEISNDLSWRDGMLVFNQEMLADAADEFNRYNQKQIFVKGAARNIRIGGKFRADNVEAFVRLAQRALGVTVTDDPQQITISK